MNIINLNPKKSIGNRISLIFVIVMIICVGSISLFNSLFLEDVYLNERANVLKKSYEVLNSTLMDAFSQGYSLEDLMPKENNEVGPGARISTSDTFLTKFISELQDTYNVSIVILDSNSNAYSLWRNPQRLDEQLQTHIFNEVEIKNSKSKQIFQNEHYQILLNNMGPQKNVSNNSNLECWGFFSDNQTSFLMSTPIVSIKEPIKIFNKNIFLISIIVICMGTIFIYISSMQITNPIKKLALLSNKMSKLDFSEKYKDVREDEIATLGISMNEMSSILERTINDLQKANVQLKHDISEKEKLDIMRQEFVANVSHELKTPIALIQGYAEGLIEGMAEEREARDYYCNVIQDEAIKMNKIVRQLLNLSSIERGSEVLDLSNVNLVNIVKSTINASTLLINEKNINLSIDIPKDTNVYVDELKLEEIIRNYLTNAINHVDENKIIKIYIEKLQNNKIRLNFYNSGSGLSEENLKLVWEKFYKVDKAHTRAYGGTGLGLSIVKAIANQHHTTCGCMNTKDGIIFYFDLDKSI
ncbi:MAG: histidine kinase dimerization/phospho-acceptor domain-containing protein [Eubacteriales bacterium]|nr:histidine kinase dimerization/phospho-acceptor domain-containing protein [Eubacteriales bacterium]